MFSGVTCIFNIKSSKARAVEESYKWKQKCGFEVAFYFTQFQIYRKVARILHYKEIPYALYPDSSIVHSLLHLFYNFLFFILLSSFHLSISLSVCMCVSVCVCVCVSPEPFESKLETFTYWAFTTKYLCIFPKNKAILLYNHSKLSKPETLTSVQCFYPTHCLNANFTDCFNSIL